MAANPQSSFYTRDIFQNHIEKFAWSIGEFTYGKPAILGAGDANLRIGKFCSIADGVKIFLGREHRTDWVSTYPFSVLAKKVWTNGQGIKGHPHSKGDVTIGHDVWLASNCTVLSGVTIGTGAVVAAHALVTKDVPPYSIVAGVPAKITRYRFAPEIIEKLLATEWWARDIEEINQMIPMLLSNDPLAVIQWLEAHP